MFLKCDVDADIEHQALTTLVCLCCRYLMEPESWSECLQPVHIVEWNVTLLCVLLGLAVLEFILCLLQLCSGVVNAVCRPCCYKQEYSLNA